MPSSVIPGFVKKRTAAQRYRRSPRQLTRDITLAIELSDPAVLPHLRIRTEDGEQIEAGELTVDRIKKLREDGRNPMWYLRTSWLEETYGRRTKDEAPSEDIESAEASAHVTSDDSAPDGSLLEMFKEQIRELKEDKAHLKAQIQIKDSQIEQSNQRWGETNVLLKSLQDQLALPAATRNGETPTPAPAVVQSEGIAAEKGSRRPPKKRAPQKSKPAAKPKKRTAKKKQSQRKPKWYETPTLNRIGSRLLHRSS